MITKDFLNKYVYPVVVISGSIIGVGFFSLPYIAMKVGVWLMLAYFLILSIIVITIHLIFTEISLKTPDYKRFPGFVGYHLGNRGKVFSLCSTIISSYGVLLVYLIVGSEFLTNIMQPYFGGSFVLYALIYFLFISIIIWLGIKAVAKVELWVLCLLLLSMIFVFIKGFSHIELSNIFIPTFKFQLSNLFLPYGPILFSLWGISLIPEVEEMVKKDKKNVNKIIIISTLIPVVFYIFFTFLILSITGIHTTESALIGLKDFLGNGAVLIIFLIGMLTTITACIAQGLTLKKVFIYDLKIKDWQALVMTCAVPLILFLLGLKSFIGLVSFIGGVLLGIDGILILLMYKKIYPVKSSEAGASVKQKLFNYWVGGKRIIIYPLAIIFLLGIIYEIFYFI